MKSILTKGFPLKLSLLTLMVAGLSALMPTNNLKAQTAESFSDFYTVPVGPYVASDVAIPMVEGHMEYTKELTDGLNPVLQQYRNLQAKIDFLLEILANLNAGKSVQSSIEGGLYVLTSDAHSTLSKAIRQEYKQEAIELLQL